MSGPPPKRPEDRVRRNKPVGGEWKPAPAVGWQHGDPTDKRRKFPKAPEGLMPESAAAWDAWFASWWAAHWKPEDLPGLRMVIREFDRLARGDGKVNEVRALLAAYGITPEGQQKLRWLPPKEQTASPAAASRDGKVTPINRPRVAG